MSFSFSSSSQISVPHKRIATLAAAACALGLMAGAALAQPAGSSTNTMGPNTAKSANTGANTNANTGANTMTAAMRADSKLVGDIAQANHAEIASGQLALEKSQNAEVKKFAQQMVDDHSAALKEVTALATSKGMTLPDGPDLKHKTMATAMKALKGDAFDSQYVKRAGVGDHEATLALLRKTQKDAKDADVKMLASKMQPTVEHHLMMAKQMVTTVAKK